MPARVPLRVSRSGGEKGYRLRDRRGVERAPGGEGVEREGQRREQPLALAEGERVQLPQRRGKVRLRALRQLVERGLVGGVERHREGGVEEPLAPALHLVPQAGDILEGDLRLGGEGAAPVEGEALGGLEAHLLPLERAGGLVRGDGPEVEREVHGHARRHQPLEEAGGERARPAPEVQGAREVVPEPQVAAVDLDLDGRLLVPLRGGAAEGRGQQQAPQGAALERVDGESGPREQGLQFLHTLPLAGGVEATVEDALARLEVSEQALKGLRCFPRLWGQPLGLLLLEGFPHPTEVGRVLAHEQLDGEVEGVEEAGEGPELRFVQLQPLHLADAHLDAVEPHHRLLLQMGEEEAERQRQGRLRFGSFHCLGRSLVGALRERWRGSHECWCSHG